MSLLDRLPTGHFPSVYGDAIMQLTPVVQSYFENPSDKQRKWDRKMATCWMFIELDYGMLFNLFKVMTSGEMLLHLYNNGEEVF